MTPLLFDPNDHLTGGSSYQNTLRHEKPICHRAHETEYELDFIAVVILSFTSSIRRPRRVLFRYGNNYCLVDRLPDSYICWLVVYWIIIIGEGLMAL
jgi:hypothetical protein